MCYITVQVGGWGQKGPRPYIHIIIHKQKLSNTVKHSHFTLFTKYILFRQLSCADGRGAYAPVHRASHYRNVQKFTALWTWMLRLGGTGSHMLEPVLPHHTGAQTVAETVFFVQFNNI